MSNLDDDLKGSRKFIWMRQEVQRLRDAIRLHRDQRGDDRCWIDDDRLYGTLPEGTKADTLLDPELMHQNCQRFIQLRQHPRDRFSWGDSPGGSMLPMLEQAELELPSLLKSRDGWQSLLVGDEKPNVWRLWMPYGEGRLLLHVIHPCGEGEALYHPHPWPSAMRIHKGWYETAYGHGPPDGPPPPMGAPKVIGNGAHYEMVDPNAWHYVRPLGGPAYSVMVIGKRWGAPGVRKGQNLGPLPGWVIDGMFNDFRGFYPLVA